MKEIAKNPISAPRPIGRTIIKLLKILLNPIKSLITNRIDEYNPRTINSIEPEIPGITRAAAIRIPAKKRYIHNPNVNVDISTVMEDTRKQMPTINAIATNDNAKPFIDSWPFTFLYNDGIPPMINPTKSVITTNGQFSKPYFIGVTNAKKPTNAP